jgi:ATP-dependent RNA helicase DHX57
MILPLHGSMSGDEQIRVFVHPPEGTIKIVLSTNLAETSITVDDVVWVIDGGRMKETQYDPGKKMASLVDSCISQANGLQRRGRAGRVQAGVCFHLVTSHRWRQLPLHQIPEIFRVPLEQIALRCVDSLPPLTMHSVTRC